MSVVGLTLSSYYLSELALKLPSGWLVDHFGRRRPLVAGLALSVVSVALLAQVGEAFPQFVPAEHVLETGINNPNPIIHVPVYLMNFARIEQGEAPVAFDFHAWMTPAVERLHLALDAERLALARALRLAPLSYAEINRRSYRGGGRKIVPAEPGVPKSAESLPPRFIAEDVPMGLVPLASLGRALGVPTPAIEGVIHVAQAATGQDFWRQGRTLAALGLEGYDLDQLLTFVRTGRPAAAA
jgi:opine dehydrogenase